MAATLDQITLYQRAMTPFTTWRLIAHPSGALYTLMASRMSRGAMLEVIEEPGITETITNDPDAEGLSPFQRQYWVSWGHGRGNYFRRDDYKRAVEVAAQPEFVGLWSALGLADEQNASTKEKRDA